MLRYGFYVVMGMHARARCDLPTDAAWQVPCLVGATVTRVGEMPFRMN